MMTIELHREFRDWREMILWLTQHCGLIISNNPAIHWRGSGWELRYSIRSNCWHVSIENEHLLTIFLLRWA